MNQINKQDKGITPERCESGRKVRVHTLRVIPCCAFWMWPPERSSGPNKGAFVAPPNNEGRNGDKGRGLQIKEGAPRMSNIYMLGS